MKYIKLVWQWLDGKKTGLAAMYWGAVMPSLLVMYPEGVPANINKWVTITGFFLTAAGLGHKWYKTKNQE